MNSSRRELSFLTLVESARILRVSQRTLHRMIKQKRMPALKVGGQWRIRESQFRRWVEHKENLTSEQLRLTAPEVKG